MGLKVKIIFSIILFIIGIFAAFYFEDKYCKLIRWMYEVSTDESILFNHPRKYVHFASGLFVSSFGLFWVIIFNAIFQLTKKQITKNSLISLVIFMSITWLYSYLSARFILIECTVCDDGKLILNYNKINYDLIFMVSLGFTLIPWIWMVLKNLKKGIKVQ